MQLMEARVAKDKLEKEVMQLHVDFTKTNKEKENLEIKMKKLEVNYFFRNPYSNLFFLLE